MWSLSFSSFAICFLFFFLVFPNSTTARMDPLSNNIDIVNRTCKKCIDEYSSHFSYQFCKSSLQVIPSSHVSSLHGLAVIGMELALKNATYTLSSIKNLLNSGTFDPFAMARLQECMELYSDAIVALIDGVTFFLTEHYSNAHVELKAVMEASTKCEDGFREKKGEASPLTKLNYNLFHLCDIALCIIDLV